MFCLLALLVSLVSPAATYVVTNVNDSGPGSLRDAITNANYIVGLDTITFQIPGTGVHTIVLATALPTITDQVVIDATTQPGYVNQPLIELNGAAVTSSAGFRLVASASGSTIRGLAINRFGSHGIQADGGGNHVFQGNFIGTDPTGAIARGNGLEGIYLNGSFGNTVGGVYSTNRNVIAANGDAGVYIINAGNNTIQGNYIGLTAAGTAALGNANNGVLIYSSGPSATGNRIGGPATGARNVIAGNRGSGVYLNGAGVTGNFVQGNFIGTTAGGGILLSNVGDGVTLQAAVANVIGGTNANEGNVICGNGKAGVSLAATAMRNVIQGNFIGTDATGRAGLGNSYAGVTISAASSNLVGGTIVAARNVIAGNQQDGVFLTTNAVGNTIAANYLGVDVTGTAALPNGFNGVSIASAGSNLVGGANPGSRNVISGNANYGIEIYYGSTGNSVQGNFIGTGTNGATALGNVFAGVAVIGASGNTIGGMVAAAGNVISANQYDAGMYFYGSANANQVLGNIIGADATGNLGLGNGIEGIYVESCVSNTIGLPGAGNLISANATRGIYMTNSSWTVIQANFVGTKADGVSPLGNTFHNIEFEANSTNNTIGGPANAGNRIAFAPAGYAGVRIRPGSLNNRITSNAIFSNGALGLDLDTAGVNLNDPCDADTGANMLQNFPVLSQAVSGSGTGIRGTFNSTANRSFLLQFFANPSCDNSGHGEGQIYLGDATVTTDASCNASFVARLPVPVPVGYAISATATDGANNTSEFSACATVASVPALNLKVTAQQASISWTNTASGFALKQTGSLNPPVFWQTVTNLPVNAGGQFTVTLPLTRTNNFFALSFE